MYQKLQVLTTWEKTWGSSWGDYNGDGWTDLWVGNHGWVPNLYVNNGNGTFTDVASQLGLDFLLNNDSHGASWIDFDNDGDQDLFLLVGAQRGTGNGSNFLFVNNNGILQDQASFYGLDYSLGRGRTPLWLDYDKDGLLDIMIGNAIRKDGQAPPALFHHTAQGFEDVTDSNDLKLIHTVESIQISDVTGDGKMELLFLNPIPQGIYALNKIPFKNIQASFEYPKDWILDFAVGDFNGDTKPDLFLLQMKKHRSVVVAEDFKIKSNFYVTDDENGFSFSSQGPITFNVFSYVPSEIPIFLGSQGTKHQEKKFTVSPDETSSLGMMNHKPGKDIGIYIGYEPLHKIWRVSQSSQGHSYSNIVIESQTKISDLQYVQTNPSKKFQDDILLINKGNGFEDKTIDAGFENPSACRSVVTGDFDNDMDLDIYMVCSLIVQNLENKLYENLGDGSFNILSNFGAEGDSFGVGDTVSMADYNNDGFLDLFVTNGYAAKPYPTQGNFELFRNTGNSNNWLEIDLIGSVSNKDGIGSKVFVTAGNKTQLREQAGGMHFATQNDKRLHFGLGTNSKADQIIVFWPSGLVNKKNDVLANQIIEINEN